MAGSEQALYLGRHEAGTGVKQRKRGALEIVAIRLSALTRMEILARLQAADAHALIEIQSWTPAQLQALLEAIPDLLLFPKHAGSIRLQAPGKDIGRSLRGRYERSGDSLLIGSALGRLSDQLSEQFGDGMSGTDTPLIGGIATAAPDTLGHTQIRRPDIHVANYSFLAACLSAPLGFRWYSVLRPLTT